MVSLLYVFIWWDLVPTSPWEKLHPVSTAMLIVTMISIRTHSVRHTISIGNRFPWLYINCFQSLWFRCIIIESGISLWWVSKGGELLVSKEREVKKERGWGGLIHPSTLCVYKMRGFLWKIKQFSQKPVNIFF